MKKRTRRLLFYAGAILFVFVGYVIIVYAQGYKYSFKESRFLRTGALSLKVNTEAKVFVDDELISNTSFLTNSFSLDRLLPGQYVVRLHKDGYSSWQKTVTTEEGKVVDFPRILILPQTEEKLPEVLSEIDEAFLDNNIVLNPTPSPRRTPVPSVSPLPSQTPDEDLPVSLKDGKLVFVSPEEGELIAAKVAGFAVSDSRKQIVWWTANELWVMWLGDINDHQPYRRAGDKELITRFTSTIKRAAWFMGEDHVVVDANGYRIVEIDKRGGINIIKI